MSEPRIEPSLPGASPAIEQPSAAPAPVSAAPPAAPSIADAPPAHEPVDAPLFPPFMHLLLGVILSAIVCIPTTTWLVERRLAPQIKAAGASTPVVVLDAQSVIERVLSDPSVTNPDKTSAAIGVIATQAQQLADQGYIVLRAESVLSAPDARFVPRRVTQQDLDFSVDAP